MKYELEFTIPGLPSTTNSSGRKHWAIKAKEARQWKTWVYYEVHKHRPTEPLLKARLTLTRVSSGECDSDGLVSSFKHVIDGLVYAGILVNDRFSNIGMPEYRQLKCAPKQGHIMVKIEEL